MSQDTFEDIVDTFAFLDDWEDRYRHIIDMGKEMPDLDEAFQVPATKVFTGTSDAMIVRGLIAILKSLYSGQKARDILDIDAFARFGELGLDQHLSAQRSNGLRAMVERIRSVAASANS